MNKDYTPFEAHHFYWGWLLLLIFFVLIFVEWIPVWFLIVGFYLSGIMVIDDIIQHIRQRKDKTYRSPLHKLYGKYLYKIGWIRKLNVWVDKLFGG